MRHLASPGPVSPFKGAVITSPTTAPAAETVVNASTTPAQPPPPLLRARSGSLGCVVLVNLAHIFQKFMFAMCFQRRTAPQMPVQAAAGDKEKLKLLKRE